MAVVVLSNTDNKSPGDSLHSPDIELHVAEQRQPRVVELHTMIIQCLCEMIELSLFGSYDQE